MRKVKIVDAVVQGKRLFPRKYSLLRDLSSRLYIGPNGELTPSIMAAEEFWGWWWQRNAAARAFAKQHGFEVTRKEVIKTFVTVEYSEGWFYLKDDSGNYLQQNSIPGCSVVFGDRGNAIACADQISVKKKADCYQLKIDWN